MITKAREDSIRTIFNKYETEPSHARQVTKLALIIFDKTRSLIHNMSDNERDFLEAGALLHDIGYYISARGHNKNSSKIIQKENLSGFSEREKMIIANIARYHRGKLPKKKHSKYVFLPDEDKKTVKMLSAFLRIADGLDRTHCSVVRDIDFTYDSFFCSLSAFLKLNTPECSFEILKANDKKDLFEKEFGIELKFKIS